MRKRIVRNTLIHNDITADFCSDINALTLHSAKKRKISAPPASILEQQLE